MDDKTKNRNNKLSENIAVIVIIAIATISLFIISQYFDNRCLLKTKTFINNNTIISSNIQLDEEFNKQLISFCKEKTNWQDLVVSFTPNYETLYVTCTRVYYVDGERLIGSKNFPKTEYKEWQNNR